MNKLIRIALTFLLVMTTGVIQAEIVIYPVPQGIYYARHNDDYTVKVRQVGVILAELLQIVAIFKVKYSRK